MPFQPDVIKLAIARVRQWIREHPEASIISVSQTIGQVVSARNARRWMTRRAAPVASLLRFVNTIAEAIEADHPNVRIDTLAYQSPQAAENAPRGTM